MNIIVILVECVCKQRFCVFRFCCFHWFVSSVTSFLFVLQLHPSFCTSFIQFFIHLTFSLLCGASSRTFCIVECLLSRRLNRKLSYLSSGKDFPLYCKTM